jgi:2-amino-4-hydroxy-6-hydroxymethyldihydropteridine diphosphokinase
VNECAFIALGSNLGDSVRLVLQAMDRLQQHSQQPLLRSSLWRSQPVNCPPNSPPFVNAVAALVPFPAETPETLLGKLQVLEKEFGRQPKKRLNEPRPLDLDLIAFGTVTCQTAPLILPHPRAHLRRFVLEPLAEIAPDLILPRQSRTVRHLLSELDPAQQITRIESGPG